MTVTIDTRVLLGERWYAVPNVLIGGWCIVNRDVEDNGALGAGLADGAREIGHFISEAVARHIVDLHNASLDQRGSRP